MLTVLRYLSVKSKQSEAAIAADAGIKASRKRKKAIVIVLSVLVFFLVIGPMAAAPIIYESLFGGRIETNPSEEFRIEEFDNLSRERYVFSSDRGDELVGYLYHNELVSVGDVIGTVVLAHGFGGGGQRTYMDVTAELAENGFDVFAYDATGNDESAGKGIIGMPHGVKDLDYAIDFVETNFDEDDIFLWGHSWGAYCASAVLTEHPEVKAVCAVSGMNTSLEAMVSKAEYYAGPVVDAGIPFLAAYQAIRCGKGAGISALDGFAASDTDIIIVQSKDDTTVPLDIGYDKYYELYANDPRFTFILFDDRGHSAYKEDELDEELFEAIIEEFAASADK